MPGLFPGCLKPQLDPTHFSTPRCPDLLPHASFGSESLRSSVHLDVLPRGAPLLARRSLALRAGRDREATALLLRQLAVKYRGAFQAAPGWAAAPGGPEGGLGRGEGGSDQTFGDLFIMMLGRV